jgi:threonylcarbamoyladenosine tRNA methylthiotransferase MtaB
LISDKLIQLFKEKKICPHIHLPFQTGDNRVLAGMNKKETVELYEEITAKLTAICPDIAISCDIMIGFPGETSQTFDNTLRFLRKIKPMRMHIFSFSPRENTPLAENQTQSKIVLSQRQMILKNLNEEFSREYYKKFIGKTLRIIGEEYDGDFTCGYTENYIYTYVENKLPLGTIVPVIIYRISNGKVYAQEIKNTD